MVRWLVALLVGMYAWQQWWRWSHATWRPILQLTGWSKLKFQVDVPFEGSCDHLCQHILPLTLGATPALSNLSPCCTRLGYLKGSCLRNCWPWLNIICLSWTAASPVALLSETLLEKIFEGLWKDLWGFHESPLGYPHCNPRRSFQWDCEWSLRIFEVPAKLFKDLTRSFKLSQICYRIFKGTWRIYVTVSCGIL